MEILSGILLGLGLILLVILTRPFTTTVHELGHAIPSLLFTDKPVTVYVGSYGNIDNTWQIAIGRLKYIFKLNLLDWNMGMCQHDGKVSRWQNVLIVLGGPIFSLLLGLTLWFFYTSFSSEIALFVVAVFVVSTILDFIVNIIPSNKPLRLHDGGAMMNDGSQLVYLLQTRNYPDAYYEAQSLIYQGHARQGMKMLEEIKEGGFHPKELYILMYSTYMAGKHYDEVVNTILDMREKHKLIASDFEVLGWAYYEMGKKTEGIQLLSKAIEMDFWSSHAFNNRGYIYNDLGYYEKALEDLDRAIYVDGKFAFAFNNRGYAQVMLGNIEKGEEDILKSLSLNDKNAYAYRNLGICYFKKGNFEKAHDKLLQAASIDENIPELKDYLKECELKMHS